MSFIFIHLLFFAIHEKTYWYQGNCAVTEFIILTGSFHINMTRLFYANSGNLQKKNTGYKQLIKLPHLRVWYIFFPFGGAEFSMALKKWLLCGVWRSSVPVHLGGSLHSFLFGWTQPASHYGSFWGILAYRFEDKAYKMYKNSNWDSHLFKAYR